MNSAGSRKVILFLQDTDSTESLIEALGKNGFEVLMADDPEAGLAAHRKEPFQLAIVEEGYQSLSASTIVQELLKISWTTHSIIISDTDEEQLHEQAEGLGILGGMKDRHDLTRLDDLLATLKKILGASCCCV